MDQLGAMEVFKTVVETGSFSAASRKLNMPLPTVSRKVADLEQLLNSQLITRTTRKISLTESGIRYLEAARRILEDVNEAGRMVSDEYIRPTGTLTITAPIFFGRLHILPIIRDFIRAYPEVNINLHLSDHILHLLEQNIDLGLRIGQLGDSSMIAKPLGKVRRIMCASPQYLSQNKHPQTPDDLANHKCILFSSIDAQPEWGFLVDGKIEYYSLNPSLIVNSAEAAVESAVDHLGLTRVLSYQAARYIDEGKLERVLDRFCNDKIPVSFIYPQNSESPDTSIRPGCPTPSGSIDSLSRILKVR